MGLKNALLKRLLKAGGQPYSESGEVGDCWADFTISRTADNRYHLDWELTGSIGETADVFSDEFDSYADMWDILRELMRLEERDE
jgi:hypothetical protein